MILSSGGDTRHAGVTIGVTVKIRKALIFNNQTFIDVFR